MKRQMPLRSVMTLLLVPLLVAGCAHGAQARGERLAALQSHAGAPLKQVRYTSPVGWEEVDNRHILLTMRPREVYLMRLSGPCLDYDAGSPVLLVSSTAGYVASGFDRVTIGASQLSCRIDEIRAVDLAALRATQANAQAARP